jgi:hypothetical protein
VKALCLSTPPSKPIILTAFANPVVPMGVVEVVQVHVILVVIHHALLHVLQLVVQEPVTPPVGQDVLFLVEKLVNLLHVD